MFCFGNPVSSSRPSTHIIHTLNTPLGIIMCLCAYGWLLPLWGWGWQTRRLNLKSRCTDADSFCPLLLKMCRYCWTETRRWTPCPQGDPVPETPRQENVQQRFKSDHTPDLFFFIQAWDSFASFLMHKDIEELSTNSLQTQKPTDISCAE